MECSIVRDLKRSAGAGMVSKKVSFIRLTVFFSPNLMFCFHPFFFVFLFFKYVYNSKLWFQIKLVPH